MAGKRRTVERSARTGKFVPKGTEKRRPSTTVRETVSAPRKSSGGRKK